MSTISASTTTTTAYKVTADTTGALVFQTGSTPTTAVNIDTSQNLQFNSGYGSVATAYGCRAWVCFNGTTASPSTIRGSGNVSSVTKNATGDFTINFTSSLVDANYAVALGATYGTTASAPTRTMTEVNGSRAAASCRVATGYTFSGGFGAEDETYTNVAVFR
jgi:hypothetical protein